MGTGFQSSNTSTGFGVGMGAAFASAAAFPHYAIQQGIPYNVYGYDIHITNITTTTTSNINKQLKHVYI